MNKVSSDFIVMPEAIEWHNGTHERCDMAQGCCSCGAWHKLEHWPEEMQALIKKLISIETNV